MVREAASDELISAFHSAMARLSENLVYIYKYDDKTFEVWAHFSKKTAVFIRVKLEGRVLTASSTFEPIDKLKGLCVFPLYNAILIKIRGICNVKITEDGTIVSRKELSVDNIEEEDVTDSLLETVSSVIAACNMLELLVTIGDAANEQDTTRCAGRNKVR